MTLKTQKFQKSKDLVKNMILIKRKECNQWCHQLVKYHMLYLDKKDNNLTTYFSKFISWAWILSLTSRIYLSVTRFIPEIFNEINDASCFSSSAIFSFESVWASLLLVGEKKHSFSSTSTTGASDLLLQDGTSSRRQT